MLYQWHEALRRMSYPAVAFAGAWSEVLNHPSSPWSLLPGTSQMAANMEFFHHLGKDYEKPEFGIHALQKDGRTIPVVETLIDQTPFCRLLRFKRYADHGPGVDALHDDPSVLVVAPLSGHHATLLRDTVSTLLADHKVYITDWTDARLVPTSQGSFGLDDYVHTVERFIRCIGTKNLHVLAVCQPVVPVLGAISLMAARGEPTPASMTLMGGPIDTRLSPTAVNNLATRQPYEWFEQNLIHAVPSGYAGVGRRVYPGFLQHMGFVAMNPERHSMAHWKFYEQLIAGEHENAKAHRKFYDEYNAVMDLPAEYYLDTIKTVFQEHLLPKGQWEVAGELVKPSAIKSTALITIEGARDDIAGQGQTQAAHALCSNIPAARKVHLLADTGHYGAFSGSRWRNEIYPKLRRFIARHAD